MNKEDITAIAHLLTSMKDSTEKIDRAIKEKNAEKLAAAKNEILSFQAQINSLL